MREKGEVGGRTFSRRSRGIDGIENLQVSLRPVRDRRGVTDACTGRRCWDCLGENPGVGIARASFIGHVTRALPVRPPNRQGMTRGGKKKIARNGRYWQ